MPWDTDQDATAPHDAQPPLATALARGLRGRCPTCGEGRLFNGYLRVVDACSSCHAPLGRIRADDAPPYATIFLAGHLLVPGVLLVEKIWRPEMWVHMALWLPLFTITCMALLRPVKGAVLAWMLRLGLTGDEQGLPVAASARPRDARDA